MPETTKKPVVKRTTKKTENTTPKMIIGFTPRENIDHSKRSIGNSLSNSISNTAEVIEELSEDFKKGLKTVGKVFDYACTELDVMDAEAFTEGINRLVALGHSAEVAYQMLEERRLR